MREPSNDSMSQNGQVHDYFSYLTTPSVLSLTRHLTGGTRRSLLLRGRGSARKPGSKTIKSDRNKTIMRSINLILPLLGNSTPDNSDPGLVQDGQLWELHIFSPWLPIRVNSEKFGNKGFSGTSTMKGHRYPHQTMVPAFLEHLYSHAKVSIK